MFFTKRPIPPSSITPCFFRIQKEDEDKLLSVEEFEALMDVSFIPKLDFSDFSRLEKITKKTLKFHKKKQLSRSQLWWGSYFKEQIMNPAQLPLAIRWIDQQLGWGVFSTSLLKKMTFIGEYAGKVRKRRGVDTKNAYCFEYQMAEGVDSPYVVDAREQGGVIRFINHSKTPNLTSMLATFNGISHIIFVAKEPIPAGTQLLYDYGENYWTYRPHPRNLS